MRFAALLLPFACHASMIWAEAPLPALSLPPGAEETTHQRTLRGEFRLPTGPWEAGSTPALVLVGLIDRRAWRLPGRGDQTLDLAGQLRSDLARLGFEILFACATDACGGFDFRFDLDLLDEPMMHVDLSDFRFLAAVRGSGPDTQHLGLTISRAGSTAYVELTLVGAAQTPLFADTPPEASPSVDAAATGVQVPSPAGIIAGIEAEGRAVLDDLSFESGSADLAPTPAPSLAAIAAFLAAHPEATILIVGHTDASGSLAANLSLSRKRAEAVVGRLIRDHSADPARIAAEGAGPLAPIATNRTEAGRQKNRRVEAVLTSTR